jgi:hypothetical protein
MGWRDSTKLGEKLFVFLLTLKDLSRPLLAISLSCMPLQ